MIIKYNIVRNAYSRIYNNKLEFQELNRKTLFILYFIASRCYWDAVDTLYGYSK